MSDLISKQDAINALVEKGQSSKRYKLGEFWELNLSEIKEALDRVPSAEPERKKGKWIDGMPYVNSHWKVCSECHESAPDICGGFNYCPNCGADMRGENEKA